jgi:zinc protease
MTGHLARDNMVSTYGAAAFRRGSSLLALTALLLAAPVLGQTARPAAEPATAPAPAAFAPTPQASAAWGIGANDVPFDPAVLLGVLPNGMRYAIRRNTTPLGSVILRMRYDVGSIAEAEDQRGLAHFIEHMAFNGSTHIAEGEMIPLLERNGLAFGPDTNASTGID